MKFEERYPPGSTWRLAHTKVFLLELTTNQECRGKPVHRGAGTAVVVICPARRSFRILVRTQIEPAVFAWVNQEDLERPAPEQQKLFAEEAK